MVASRLLSSLVLILAVTSAWSIDVDSIQKEHRPIVVTHDPGEVISVMYWADGKPVLLDDSHFVRRETETIWTAPAGTYAVIREGSAVVVVTTDGSPNPQPGPRPDPEPQPPQPQPEPEPEPQPEPDVDRIVATWIVVVEELNERHQDPARTSIITDRLFWDSFGLKFRLMDKDQESAKDYRNIIADGVPSLILLDADGNYRVTRLPSTREATESWIRSQILR